MTCILRWAKHGIICALTLLLPIFLGAQNLLSGSGGAFLGSLGSIKSVAHGSVSMIGNPAGIAGTKHLSLYAGGELRNAAPDLKFVSLSMVIPSDFGAFGVVLQHHGFELFNERMIALGYARQLFEEISIGAKFDYFQLSIPTYGTRGYLSGELGLQTSIGRWVEVGFYVYHPFEQNLVENEVLPNQFSLGLSYRPTDKLWVVSEIAKQSGYQEDIKFGLEYYFIDEFALRFGVNTAPALISFGIAYRPAGNLSFDVGSVFHQSLGVSPLIGIGYDRKP